MYVFNWNTPKYFKEIKATTGGKLVTCVFPSIYFLVALRFGSLKFSNLQSKADV